VLVRKELKDEVGDVWGEKSSLGTSQRVSHVQMTSRMIEMPRDIQRIAFFSASFVLDRYEERTQGGAKAIMPFTTTHR
jgi:hypothetical protein